MSRPRLLLLGRRRGALLAAARLDAEVLLLDDSGRPGRAAGAHLGAKVSFDDPAGCVRAAEELTGRGRVDAVVALVERSVVPAAAVREALGVPGASLAQARPWRDKVAMKQRASAAGVPTAGWREVRSDSDPERLVRELGLPLVIKPRASSGSRGTVIAPDVASVRAARADGAMAESFLTGVEMSVESLVQGGEVIFENATEYFRPGWSNIVPAVLPEAVDRAVREINRRVLAALDITDGLTHLEVFVDHTHEGIPTVVFGEIGVRPPGGFIMELLGQVYGFDPWRALLDIEMRRPTEPPARPLASAGVWFLHPGEGEVLRVAGLDGARAVAGVLDVDCRVTTGQRFGRREGVGQHAGRILVRTDSRERTAAALERAASLVRFRTRRAA